MPAFPISFRIVLSALRAAFQLRIKRNGKVLIKTAPCDVVEEAWMGLLVAF